MQHIDKIEKFFEFLEEHLESGFTKKKREYSLHYYDEFFDATRNDNTDEPILVIEGGYIETDPVTGNEEYFDEDIYLNPFKQIKRIDVRKQGENDVIKSYEISLYNDLYQFYHSEFRKFKRKFYQSFFINFPSGGNQGFLTNFFIAIEDFQERAENPKFSVKNNNGEDIQLLSFYLKSLVYKIKQKYLNETVLENNEKNKDATTIRQAFIIHQLLEKVGCNATDVHRADFAVFLTGKHKQNLRKNLRGKYLNDSDKNEIIKQLKQIGLDDFANDSTLTYRKKN